MFKTISDKIFSLWPNHTNNIDSISAGSKRKRYNDECDANDVDSDLHMNRVKKKRLTDSPSTFVDTIKTSVSNMAQWLKIRSKRYSEEFNVTPHNKKESASTSHNGDPIIVPQVLDDRRFTNHRFSVQRNTPHYKGVTSNGTIDEEVKNGISQNVSRCDSKSSAFQHRPSTASMCVRLKEKEEYKKLLKLQSQYSPWQQQLSLGIPNASSSVNASDVVSISSESSGDQNLQRTSGVMTETKPTPAVSSIPRHKMTPSHSNSEYLQMSTFKSHQTKCLLATLMDQHQRFGMNMSVRKVPVMVHKDQSFITRRVKDGASKAETEKTHDKNKGSPRKQSEPIVIIENDDDNRDQNTAAKSVLNSKTAACVKDTQTQKATDFRIPSAFLQSRFMNDKDIEDERRAKMYEQNRRKLLIEEEEMKAKAYAEKRRAQAISLDRSLKYQMRIFDDEPEVSEEIFREEEDEEEKLPELTSEMQAVIDCALRPGSGGEVLSEEFRLQITRGDIKTLSGLNWLNDEVINFYMNLLMRSGEQGERAKLYAFNTFFYPKIKSGGHAAVKRWTKNVNIFAMHYIIIPVHLGVHWCLCVADMEKKVITYYDSMGAKNNQCLCAVLQYIHDESIAKGYTAFKRNEWKLVNAEENPQQMNGGDCGMFMCMYAEYITRGKEITFTQEHMPYFRRRMVYEIISKKLLQ